MENELYHHGVLGMKWGVRRTPAQLGYRFGRKRKKDQADDDAVPKPKSHKDMTDDELRKETERLNLEANYLSAKSRANPAPSGQTQKGESFAKKFVNEAVKPAIVAAGRAQIEKFINAEVSKLTKGKVDPNSLEFLRTEAEKLGLKSKISSSKKVIESNNDWFNERAKAKAQKEVDDYNERLRDSESTGPKTYSRSGESISDRFTRTRESSNLPAVVNKPRDRVNSDTEPTRPSPSISSNLPAVIRNSVQSSGLMRTNSSEFRSAADRGRDVATEIIGRDGSVLGSFDADGNYID